MTSIFTKIINGELPAHKVHETEDCIAILDIDPNTAGHTLCIPKKETDKIFNMAEKDYLQLMNFSYTVAQALEKTVPCKRIGIAVVGLEVAHAHVHLIPINKMADMTFTNKTPMSTSQLAALAAKIRANIGK